MLADVLLPGNRRHDVERGPVCLHIHLASLSVLCMLLLHDALIKRCVFVAFHFQHRSHSASHHCMRKHAGSQLTSLMEMATQLPQWRPTGPPCGLLPTTPRTLPNPAPLLQCHICLGVLAYHDFNGASTTATLRFGMPFRHLHCASYHHDIAPLVYIVGCLDQHRFHSAYYTLHTCCVLLVHAPIRCVHLVCTNNSTQVSVCYWSAASLRDVSLSHAR